MNEQDLRAGLQDVMVASSPPPPMDFAATLDAGKRAQRKRRTAWAGGGAGMAVIAVVAGVALSVGNPAAEQSPDLNVANSTGTPGPENKSTNTAKSGPHDQKGIELLQAVTAALPATVTLNTTILYPGAGQGSVTDSEARIKERVAGKEIWEYEAIAAVDKKGAAGTGRVMVKVFSSGNTESTDMCALAVKTWGDGTCIPLYTQDKRVVTVSDPQDPRVDQVIAYRYDDGTVVMAAQSKDPNNNRGGRHEPLAGAMTAPPLTLDELARVALSPGVKGS